MSHLIINTELENWYRHAIIDQEQLAISSRKKLFRGIRLYLGVLGTLLMLLMAIYLFFFIFYSTDLNYLGRGLLVFSSVIGFLSIAFFIYALCVAHIHSLETMKKNGVVSSFSPAGAAKLNAVLIELCASMKIDYTRVRLWKVMSSQAYPSIEVGDDQLVHLVIPPHFLLLHQQQPHKARSIMAHELGHVLQGDSQLFIVMETYYSIIRRFFIPYIILGALLKLYFGFFANAAPLTDEIIWIGVFSFLLDIFIILFLEEGLRGTRQARQRSELLADTAAMLYTNSSDILEVLDELPPTAHDSIHPDQPTRTAHAKEILSRFNMAI